MNQERREYKRDWQDRVRARNREIVNEYLSTSNCEDCGESYPYPAMTLIPGPEGGLPHRGVLHNLGKEKLETELDKLTVLCRNCKSVRDNDND